MTLALLASAARHYPGLRVGERYRNLGPDQVAGYGFIEAGGRRMCVWMAHCEEGTE